MRKFGRISGSWQEQYKSYTEGDAKKRIEELKIKIDNSEASQEEIEEHGKMKKIQDNLPKVENLKEAIDNLNGRLALLKAEVEYRNSIQKLEEEIEKEVQENIKNGIEYDDKTQEKQEKLNQMRLDHRETDITELSNDDLNKEILVTKGQISKCHLAARLYMAGLSVSEIDLKVNKEWKDRRFTAEKPLGQGKETNPNDEKASDGAKENLPETQVLHKGEGMISELDKSSGTTAISDIEGIKRDIQKAHPWLTRLSKIPLIGKRFENRLKEYVKKEQERQAKFDTPNDPDSKKDKPQEISEEKEQTAAEEFRSKYSVVNYDVIDIAEKGISGIEAEILATKKAEIEAKRAEKESARNARQEEIARRRVQHDYDWVKIEGENTGNYLTRKNPATGELEMRIDRPAQGEEGEER